MKFSAVAILILTSLSAEPLYAQMGDGSVLSEKAECQPGNFPKDLYISESESESEKGRKYRAAAKDLLRIIDEHYAYLGDNATLTDGFRNVADSIVNKELLLVYISLTSIALGDFHINANHSTGSSFALFPSMGDIWVEWVDGHMVVRSVRDDSPAYAVGLRRKMEILPPDDIIYRFLLCYPVAYHMPQYDRARSAFAIYFAAGYQSGDLRRIKVKGDNGEAVEYVLPSYYSKQWREKRAAYENQILSLYRHDGATVIRFHNSLGNDNTIAAFDAVMAQLPADSPIILDVRDTPSGGNTTVARAIMRYFTQIPVVYQIHELPAEERAYGVIRRWQEMVIPQDSAPYHSGLREIWAGRWTGSMGEGMAIGLNAMGYPVKGEKMAGLKGAIEQFPLGDSGISVSIPVERLYHANGTPREDFMPQPANLPRIADMEAVNHGD